MTKRVEYTHHFDPASRAMENVYWDYKNNELYIEMNNGSIAGYSNFYAEDYDQFIRSESKGRFWNSKIQGSLRFPGISGDVALIAAQPVANPDRIVVDEIEFSDNNNYVITVKISADSWNGAASLGDSIGETVSIRKLR